MLGISHTASIYLQNKVVAAGQDRGGSTGETGEGD